MNGISRKRPLGVARLTGIIMLVGAGLYALRPRSLVFGWITESLSVGQDMLAVIFVLALVGCGLRLAYNGRVSARLYTLLTFPLLLFGVLVFAYAVSAGTSSLFTGFLLIAFWTTLQFLFDLEQVIYS